ncbi:MAG: M14 family metallopeptidase [Verrucomicrobiales bacterium]
MSSNPEGHFSPETLRQYLIDLAFWAKRRGFVVETIWQYEGLPMPALKREGREADVPCVLLSAGMHGDEPAGPLAVLEWLRAGPEEGIFWLVTPLINPSGLVAGTRENARGLDLNRSYEEVELPEIAAQLAWLDRQRAPDYFVALHEDWEAEGFYFYEVGGTGVFREPVLDAVSAGALGIEPAAVIDGNPVTEAGWIFRESAPKLPDGQPEALYFLEKGCRVSLTFETPSAQAIADRVTAHLAGLRAMAGLIMGGGEK